MSLGYHHWHKRTGARRPGENGFRSEKFKKFLDSLVYFSAITAVAANMPQFYKIWMEHNSNGVSFWSWTIFFLSSLFWVFYGYVHRSKPIIMLNSSVAVMQLLIVIGIVVKP